MNKWRFLFIIAVLAAGTRLGLPQSPAPTPPYLAIVKPPMFWKISITYAEIPAPTTPAAPSDSDLIETNVTKWADRKKVEDKLRNGKIFQTWFYRGFALMSQRHYMEGSVAVFPDDGADPAGFDMLDFSDLKWIGGQNFVRRESKNGVNCDLFEQGSSESKTDVWVSVLTKLPVVVESTLSHADQKLVETHTYVFEPAPLPPEAVPEKFLKPYHDRLRRMRLPIPPDN